PLTPLPEGEENYPLSLRERDGVRDVIAFSQAYEIAPFVRPPELRKRRPPELRVSPTPSQ
ncbi:MAG: hypothetical protein U9Q76_10725, partial [candidate division WOR-3 bacterium]|nr:hypothetical protein [candidate division WOR-3 bacterium]